LQLSWLERKMAATLFAEPPSSSLDEAMDHFLSGIADVIFKRFKLRGNPPIDLSSL
jgi:hypothetical protein